MKFYLDYHKTWLPVTGAEQVEVKMIEMIDIKTLNNFKNKDFWFKFGKNHREDSNYLYRDFNVHKWVVDINDLSDMHEFIIQNGDITIMKRDPGYEPNYLEIRMEDFYNLNSVSSVA